MWVSLLLSKVPFESLWNAKQKACFRHYERHTTWMPQILQREAFGCIYIYIYIYIYVSYLFVSELASCYHLTLQQPNKSVPWFSSFQFTQYKTWTKVHNVDTCCYTTFMCHFDTILSHAISFVICFDKFWNCKYWGTMHILTSQPEKLSVLVPNWRQKCLDPNGPKRPDDNKTTSFSQSLSCKLLQTTSETLLRSWCGSTLSRQWLLSC